MKIEKVKEWMKNTEMQFNPISYNAHDKSIIETVLRIKDDKIFEWLTPLYQNTYEIGIHSLFHVVRIQSFDKDNIHVEIMDGFWDTTKSRWFFTKKIDIRINDIENYLDNMNKNATEFLKEKLNEKKEFQQTLEKFAKKIKLSKKHKS